MEKKKPKKYVDLYGKHFSSNAVRLSLKEIAIGFFIFVICVFCIIPFLWRHFEKLEFEKDFRLAEQFRDDYWIYEKWANEAAEKYPVIFLGDSVIWGMYVNNENTLPAKLNRLAGKELVANLAIDGMHSVAMEGLLENYAKGIKNKTVILHYNPLWMNSRDYDLSGEKPMRIHHPRLIPQFFNKPASYDEDLTTRMDAVKEKTLPFFRLVNHIRLAFFENADFMEWMIENPYSNPAQELCKKLEICEKEKNTNSNDDWSKKGISRQNWDWLPLEKSRQWKAFGEILDILKNNNNKVLVMVGPINPYMLTDESLARYRKLQDDIKTSLERRNIQSCIVPDMPSEAYADASHPLEKGYQIIANKLYETDFMKNIRKADSGKSL
ncbi:MAG: hypothetical protein A2020_04535 [Lentisphaerae bacterium GWF2_45_14]|nr:MAG: hypothetical protein A2020_04535 [Lentisphaerae bacterium GWF2_45_14]